MSFPYSTMLHTGYTHRRSKFGAGVPVKGRREYVHVGSMLAPHLALDEGPSTPAPPKALPKFEVRKVYMLQHYGLNRVGL